MPPSAVTAEAVAAAAVAADAAAAARDATAAAHDELDTVAEAVSYTHLRAHETV